MSSRALKAKAYLKEGCPFSFKFLLFMVEADLGDQIEVIRCDPNDPQFDALKDKLAAGLRKPASFPTVEIEPGLYASDSDALIRHYTRKNGVEASSLPALTFYTETIFPQILDLHKQKSDVETREHR